jgi:predicted metalloprotease with PDZ domain
MFWLYEGVTSYYGGLTLRRAGLTAVDSYESELASTIARYEQDPGRDITSVAMSSWDVWTKQGEAPPNTYYSFYTAGSVLGLLLDLEVRGRTRNLQSLDDVMRYLYQNYAAKGIGVPEDGLQKALETITSGTFQPFFDKYVYGTEPIDYDRYLFYVGYRLVKGTDPSKPAARLGIALTGDPTSITIESVEPSSGAFEAGLDIDDEIIAFDGKRVTRQNLNDNLYDHSPGDTLSVTAFRRGHLKTFEVVLDGGGNVRYELERLPETNTLQNQTRREWLNLAAG